MTTPQNQVNSVFLSCMFLAAFGVMIWNGCPTIYWGDDGLLISASVVFGLGHAPGHPMFMLSEHPAGICPFGDLAYRYNLMSALFLSLAICIPAMWILRMARDRMQGFAGSCFYFFFTVTHPFVLHQGIRGETYALHLFLLMLAWHFLLSGPTLKRLTLGTFISGLMTGNQLLLAAISAPGLFFSWILGVFRGKKNGRLTLINALLAFCLGCSMYLYIPLRGHVKAAVSWAYPDNVHDFYRYVTAKDYQSQFFNSAQSHVLDRWIHHGSYWISSLEIDELLVFILSGLGFLFLLLEKHPLSFIGLLIVLGTFLGSAACQTFDLRNWDFQGYLMPGVVILGMWSGAAVLFMSRLVGNHTIFRLAIWGLSIAPMIPGWRTISENSLRHHNYARLYALTFMEILPEDSILLTRSDALFMITYLSAVEDYRSDLTLISRNRVDRFLRKETSRAELSHIHIPASKGTVGDWICDLIRINSPDRMVAWEMADDDRMIQDLPMRLSGSVLIAAPSEMHPAQGRDLLYFIKNSKNGQVFFRDQNAIEQVSMLLYNRGTYFLNQENVRGAIGEFTLAVQLKPDEARFHNNLGVAYAGIGYFEEARESFRRVLQLNPSHPGALKNLERLGDRP